MINIKPTANSKEAKPSIKKLVDRRVNSSLDVPNTITYTYKDIQVISEKINKFKKLLGLRQKPKIETQIIIFQ
jgi:hypothetical protein